ncbi:polyprenyl synthetase family protein [Corynebacterium heidelbergense]|uniref:Geranylgeranyl pyrophosphate synthase n=1 Tax=Corynebacterium heidelbergense TaxID=2055947 RepID=A0A364V9M3_9CORY|nr:polyprenyl synthetase family protein [Corynebacterium heidelbergense]RAV33339.1 geranylgeranyl pyrophosphate synthase [Corynebacterium heidelbergense]WCZ36356.1 (2E,6E)-farnesyl diphosphate synthase [Corynebacterium heidelbergense]
MQPWTDPGPASARWAPSTPLSEVPAACQEVLQAYLEQCRKEFGGIDPLLETTLDALADFILGGGKRVRPTLAWAGVRAAWEGGGGHPHDGETEGGVPPQAYLAAVSSLELIQACALIHDDIIDASDLRRGRPTVHRVFEKQHRDHSWHGSPEHYGISQALLAGDLVFAWADDMLTDSGVPTRHQVRARPAWRAMRTEVIVGQQLDIAVEARGSDDVADSLKVVKYKTASYTATRPLHLGASLGGADERTVDLLCQVGQQIGTAFQLRDDQLGVFGDPAVTGKPSGDDLRTGKRTALINSALARGTAAQRTEVHEALGSISSDADVELMRKVIIATGAQDHIEDTIQGLTDSANTALHNSWLHSSIIDELVGFASRLTNRRF